MFLIFILNIQHFNSSAAFFSEKSSWSAMFSPTSSWEVQRSLLSASEPHLLGNCRISRTVLASRSQSWRQSGSRGTNLHRTQQGTGFVTLQSHYEIHPQDPDQVIKMKFEKSFKKSLKSLTKRSGSYISQFTSIEGESGRSQ